MCCRTESRSFIPAPDLSLESIFHLTLGSLVPNTFVLVTFLPLQVELCPCPLMKSDCGERIYTQDQRSTLSPVVIPPTFTTKTSLKNLKWCLISDQSAHIIIDFTFWKEQYNLDDIYLVMFLYNIPWWNSNANCFVALSLPVMLIMTGTARGDGSPICVSKCVVYINELACMAQLQKIAGMFWLMNANSCCCCSFFVLHNKLHKVIRLKDGCQNFGVLQLSPFIQVILKQNVTVKNAVSIHYP